MVHGGLIEQADQAEISTTSKDGLTSLSIVNKERPREDPACGELAF